MTHIEKHLNHMLAGERTALVHVTDALVAEIAAVNRDSLALERLGREVLTLISDDLKSGLHTQKAMRAAMQGGRND